MARLKAIHSSSSRQLSASSAKSSSCTWWCGTLKFSIYRGVQNLASNQPVPLLLYTEMQLRKPLKSLGNTHFVLIPNVDNAETTETSTIQRGMQQSIGRNSAYGKVFQALPAVFVGYQVREQLRHSSRKTSSSKPSSKEAMSFLRHLRCSRERMSTGSGISLPCSTMVQSDSQFRSMTAML